MTLVQSVRRTVTIAGFPLSAWAPRGEHRLGVQVRRLASEVPSTMDTGSGISEFTLLIDGMPAGRIESRLGFSNFISWTGLDIGRDRGAGCGIRRLLRSASREIVPNRTVARHGR
jgi:hypothetical protein